MTQIVYNIGKKDSTLLIVYNRSSLLLYYHLVPPKNGWNGKDYL